MNLKAIFRRLASVLILVLVPQLLLAQSAALISSTRDGVYTADQAQDGKNIYQSKCGMCHGNTLKGMGPNAPLAGEAFLKNWQDQSVADLFMKTITMMPAMSPGSMTPKETSDVLAYILNANRFPAGKTRLPSDFRSLNAIHIDKP